MSTILRFCTLHRYFQRTPRKNPFPDWFQVLFLPISGFFSDFDEAATIALHCPLLEMSFHAQLDFFGELLLLLGHFLLPPIKSGDMKFLSAMWAGEESDLIFSRLNLLNLDC
jgi:hypothetical protein